MSIDEAWTKLLRGAADVVPGGGVRDKLELARKERRRLLAMLGVDASSSDFHVGHTVMLRKLRQVQELVHKVVLIIGVCTAFTGDPSGRAKTSRVLTLE